MGGRGLLSLCVHVCVWVICAWLCGRVEGDVVCHYWTSISQCVGDHCWTFESEDLGKFIILLNPFASIFLLFLFLFFFFIFSF